MTHLLAGFQLLVAIARGGGIVIALWIAAALALMWHHEDRGLGPATDAEVRHRIAALRAQNHRRQRP